MGFLAAFLSFYEIFEWSRNAGLITLRKRRKRWDLKETDKALKEVHKVEAEPWFRNVDQTARQTRSSVTVHYDPEQIKKPCYHSLSHELGSERVSERASEGMSAT